ncbi:hypothetical protein C7N43_00015 [Sphingobacteriales bacterium UPWRP_1]|nr:hypothetical protein BVG80_14945 [Sphingobacteriales bacterium TSM_CSM]PSJ79046.1 hypothetical protein C7N43_00015 [Sphingobacteriales bacterium UPWRP_1]
MSKLLNSLYFQVLVLGMVAGALLGCGSWFAKRQGEEKGKSEQKIIVDVPITVQNQPPGLCPKLLEGSHNTVTYNFLYVLDTSDQKCIATKWQDLFGKDKLFPFRIEDSLAFERKDNLVWNKQWDENYTYKQYYKGIPVENSRVMLNFRNGKVMRLVGTFYPNLDIDTTGMISKEEAARVVLKQRNIPDSLYSRVIPSMLRFSNIGVLPSYNKIFYSFRFYVGTDKGTWIVNAVTGKFHSYVKPDWSNVCHKCVAGNTEAVICPTDVCNVVSGTADFTDNLPFEVPTFYNNCQSIRIDSCFTDDVVYYRLSPRFVPPDGFVITDNDTINIFDASVEAAGSVMLQEERFCNKDSITTKNAIAASLFFGMNLAKNYFSNRQIDDIKRHLIWAHMPIPENNEAQYSAIDDIFLFGDGDNLNFNPFASPDVVCHEYAHSVLSHVFSINRDSVHTNQPQVKTIHEAVSDIFSVLARRHAFGTVDWTIGNQVAITPAGTFPRDLAHPENTLQPQALYYNDAANHWSSNDADIYNHAGIIVKWFYLITNGGTGAHYATDNIAVQPIGIDAAENVLIAGLQKLFTDTITVPAYEDFCQATILAANAIYPPTDGVCSPQLTAVRDAWQAVGLDCWASITPPLCTACSPTEPDTDICDNHLPYLQSVQITDAATGNTIAHQAWEWNESQTQLCLQDLSPQQSTNLAGGLILTLTASEPMNSLNFAGFENELGNVISYGYASNLTTSTNNTQWIFTISNILPDLLSEGTIRLRFTGADMAGNPLEAMQNYPPATNSPPCINAADLPYRNPATGMWTNSHSGTDNRFSFEYVCTELAYNYDITDCTVDENGYYLFYISYFIYCTSEATLSYTYTNSFGNTFTGTYNDLVTPSTQFTSGIQTLFVTITDPQTGQVVSFNPLEGLECDPLPVGGGSLPGNQDPIFTALPQISDQLTTCAGSQLCIPYEVSYWGVFESGGIVVQINRFDAVQHIFMNSGNLQTGEFCFTPDVAEVGTHHPVLRAYPAEYPYPAATTTNPLTLSVLCCPTGFNHPQELTAVYDCNGNLYQPAEATVTALTNNCSINFTVNGNSNHTLTCLGAGVYDLTLEFNNEIIQIPDAITVTGIYLNDAGLQVTHTSQPSIAACSSDQCNGQISLSVSGGSGSYTYYWSDCIPPPGEMMLPCNSPLRNQLCSGSYTVTITDDLTGCQTVYTANLSLYYPPNAGVLSDNEFSVSPTVFSGSTTLTYRVGYDAQVSISMFSSQGILVDSPIQQEFRAEGQYNMTHSPPSGLPQGVYYYVLYVCEQYITRVAIKIG